MRILAVCQYYYPEQFRINDICETLATRGHEVTVLTGLPNYPMGKVPKEYKFFKNRNEIINGVFVKRCFEIGRKKGFIGMTLNYLSFMVSATIKSMFLKKNYDVVFVNQLSPITMAVPALAYAKKNRKKVLLYALDLWPESIITYNVSRTSFVYKILLRVSKKIYSAVDCIIGTSFSFKNYFENVLEIKNEILYLPQYAEEMFLNIPTSKKSDECNLLFAGNIGTLQSVETIIKAAQILKDEVNIKFHIVGDGSEYERCKLMAKNLPNVKFYGRFPLSDMPKFYGMADAMLLTLKKDNLLSYTLPGKVQSYMAAKKPILASINGEARLVINKAGCGYCVEAENYEEYAKIIKDFYKNRELQCQMGENSFKYYNENFRKEKFITKLESFLKGLCSNENFAD